MKRKVTEPDRCLQAAWVLVAGIVVGLAIAIRIRLLEVPLERDEGEYAYAGQLMLQGIPPYKLAYNMKFPGTYVAYAVIMSVFGQTITGIHSGLLLVDVATIALIFFLGRRLIDLKVGVAAAASYAVLSMSPSVLGLAAHAEHFVMLPVLGGVLLLLRQAERDSFEEAFLSGLCLGIALLMKQPAIFFVLFGAIYLLSHDVRSRFLLKRCALRIFTFSAGALVPFAVTCLLLWRAGVFDKFWFWTIDYARQYGSLIPLGEAPHRLAQGVIHVIGPAWTIWALAGLGLVAGLRHKETQANTYVLLGLLLASTFALSSGFYFRQHYFVLVLPAVSLLAGGAISKLSDVVGRRTTVIRLVPLLVLVATLSLPVLASRKLFFEASPTKASRMIYGLNPFPESIKIAEYIRDHTTPDEIIAVLGSEPQIYFYSKRHSATGYIYTYGLMEAQRHAREMQEEMMREIELRPPKYLILVGVTASWRRLPTSDGMIFAWANHYIHEFYHPIGLVEISSLDHTNYYFDELPNPMPQLGNYILIYQRKS